MSDSRQDKAFAILAQRSVWENKQRLYYRMRHDGLERVNKPFPKCADSHFPLIDMEIGNLKPFWMSQAFSGERLADFISLKEQMADMTEAAAQFMDFELRYRTDFRYRFEQATDTMLLRGRGVLKIVFDPFTDKIVFKSIDPLYILMGEQFDDFEDADYFIEVQTLTVPQYQRNRNFNQSADVLMAIRGKQDWALQAVKLDKQLREGITHSTRDDMIVLWNFYEKTSSGYQVHTHCPLAWDKNIRPDYPVNLTWDGETLQPFYSLTMEIKDEGWYSPRGIAELNAAFEAYCTKVWNEQSDAITFGNKPIFTVDGEIANSANIRLMPGEIVPGNLKPVQMPQPAYSFGEQISFTREISEQRSKMPDYGVQGTAGQRSDGKPRTATENNRIASLQDVGADHNGDIFRNVRLIKIFRHIWALICHREDLAKAAGKPGKLSYFVADNLKTLPVESLHDQYLVLPVGGSGTKQQRLVRAVSRYQLFKGAPNIDQDELASGVIAADDSRLVKKLLMPQGLRQGKEAEDQAMEIGIMLLGFPAVAGPGEDQITRIQTIIGFLEKAHVTGEPPVSPIAKQRIFQNIAQRFQLLQQSNPQAAKQLKQQIAQMEAQMAQGAPPPNGNGAPPGLNGSPPGQPAPDASAPQGPVPIHESIAINYKDLEPDVRAQVLTKIGLVPSRLPLGNPTPLPPVNK